MGTNCFIYQIKGHNNHVSDRIFYVVYVVSPMWVIVGTDLDSKRDILKKQTYNISINTCAWLFPVLFYSSEKYVFEF